MGPTPRARVMLAAWRDDYNVRRPHAALGWRTPAGKITAVATGSRHTLKAAKLRTPTALRKYCGFIYLNWLRGHEVTYTELESLSFHGENWGSIPLGRSSNISRLGAQPTSACLSYGKYTENLPANDVDFPSSVADIARRFRYAPAYSSRRGRSFQSNALEVAEALPEVDTRPLSGRSNERANHEGALCVDSVEEPRVLRAAMSRRLHYNCASEQLWIRLTSDATSIDAISSAASPSLYANRDATTLFL